MEQAGFSFTNEKRPISSIEEIGILIRSAWERIGNDKGLSKGIIELHSNYITSGGGIVWLNVSQEADMKYAYIPRKDWGALGDKIINFQLLSKDYNPALHVLIFLSIEGYSQLVRVNIEKNDAERIFEFQLS